MLTQNTGFPTSTYHKTFSLVVISLVIIIFLFGIGRPNGTLEVILTNQNRL